MVAVKNKWTVVPMQVQVKHFGATMVVLFWWLWLHWNPLRVWKRKQQIMSIQLLFAGIIMILPLWHGILLLSDLRTLFFFKKKKKVFPPRTLNLYAIYIYKKSLHIFVLGLKLYRKVKKKSYQFFHCGIYFFFKSKVSSAYDHDAWHENT